MRMSGAYRSFLPLAIMAVLLTGCETFPSLNQYVNEIQIGDSRARVLGIVGPPGDRSVYKNQEVFQYCNHDSSNLSAFAQTASYKVIWLKGGIVEGITGYSATGPSCLFREVDWGQAPSQKIDIDVDQDIKVQ